MKKLKEQEEDNKKFEEKSKKIDKILNSKPKKDMSVDEIANLLKYADGEELEQPVKNEKNGKI